MFRAAAVDHFGPSSAPGRFACPVGGPQAATDSYARSSRPIGGDVLHRTATEFLDPIEGVLDFGLRSSVRLRIISVPCGGLSWRRDLLEAATSPGVAVVIEHVQEQGPGVQIDAAVESVLVRVNLMVPGLRGGAAKGRRTGARFVVAGVTSTG